jgi:DNA polymerase-3 subunit delta
MVLVEGDLEKNIAFTIFAPVARTIDHPPLGTGELPQWIADTARERGVRLSGRAVAALSQLIGPDLWTLSSEIDRLGAYAAGAEVDADTVAETVAAAREAKVWELTDALVEGDEAKALSAMRRLLEDDWVPPIQLSMVARQYRQLAIVKDMRERRADANDVMRAAGIPRFRVDRLGAVASRWPWAKVRGAYRRILEADLNVKRGLQDDETSLQLLIHDLCAMAPAAGRPRAAAR